MSSLSPTRYERVRENLLHVSLRQVTEDPGPGQPANLARRAASFTRNRQDLDNFHVRQAAERVAADKRKDDALRAKLNGLAAKRSRPPLQVTREVISQRARSIVANTNQRRLPPITGNPITDVPQTTPNGAPISNAMPSTASNPPSEVPATQSNPSSSAASGTSGNSRLVDRIRRKQTHVTAVFLRTKSTSVQKDSPTKSPTEHGYDEQDDVRSDTLEADRTDGSSVVHTRNSAPQLRTSRTSRLVPDSEEDEAFDEEDLTIHGLSPVLPGRSDLGLTPARLDSSQGLDLDASSALPSQCTDRHRCTRKHFRIKRIIGKQIIDGDTYYDVRWKRSWVPSHLIVLSENGRDSFVEIDGKDWYVKEIIKSKIKKGIHKHLVRWADDTQEPLRLLGRALRAVEAFEVRPKLERRVITFDESLLDKRTILPQSEGDFREAQMHLAKKWPIIEPRNDIDLLPALRQIISEDPDHPRNDNLMHRKTHFRLLDQPQVRPLRWNEAYILSGRHYECVLPRRNALLLQAVGETEGNSCCERCMSSISPFAECVMDTSDEDPWFNGGCANCGAFEANSNCLHHHVGREHLGSRGSTYGVLKESSRESRAALSRGNFGLGEQLHRLKYLSYDNGSDSETYSADSYNPSDESAESASEIDVHDDDLDKSEPLFCTPNFQLDNPQARSPSTGQSSSRLHNAQATEYPESSPVRANRPGALRRVNKGRPNPRLKATTGLSRSVLPQNIGLAAHLDKPSSVSNKAVNGPASLDLHDRSSSTLAPGPGADHVPAASDNSQDFGGCDDFWNGMGSIVENFDSTNDVELTEVGGSTSRSLNKKPILSPASAISTVTSQPLLQSIEVGDRRSAPVQVNNSLTTNGPRISIITKGKKRASSQPPMHERPSRRSLTDWFCPFVSMSSETPVTNGSALPEDLHLGHRSCQVKEEFKRVVSHPDCVNHRPCVHPNNFTIRSRHPPVTVYRNDVVYDSRGMTVGQAEYIISRCTCHWANGFTEVWADAQGQFGNLSKAEVLLAHFEENLWRAARDCCPLRPGDIECIVIDD